MVTAHALHTGVHARLHTHHGHARHPRHSRSELRAAIAPQVHVSHPAPVAPPKHTPRPHAMLPHAATKLHRSPTSGGAPYALGRASLSLGLSTRGLAMPATRNELISDPSSGILKGRSPPRGIPLRATSSRCTARSAALPRAPADPIRDRRLRPAFPSPRNRQLAMSAVCVRSRIAAGVPLMALAVHVPHPALLARGIAATRGRAVRRGPSVRLKTPDRASEGRTAGLSLPSWRSVS